MLKIKSNGYASTDSAPPPLLRNLLFLSTRNNVRAVSFRARRRFYLFMKYVVEIQKLLKNSCWWKEVVVESDYTYKKRVEHVYKVTYRINNRLLCLLTCVKTVRWYIIRVGYKRDGKPQILEIVCHFSF